MAKSFLPPFFEASSRQLFAWALGKQGKMEEAKAQLIQAQKIIETAQKRFKHVNVQASLMTFTHPEVNQAFEIRLDLVNVSKSQGSIIKVENTLVQELKIVDASPNCLVHEGQIELKDKTIKSFEVKTVKLTVKATKPGEFRLNPTVTYLDDLGGTKTSVTRPLTITVQPAKPKYEILPGRISTGFSELDTLLFGGIPENYAAALTSPSTDEKELLVKRFLETGATAGETTFYITTEAANTKTLTEKFPANFILILCNPQADAMIQDLPNVHKLKGIENLTEIDIALAKAFRTLSPSAAGPKRICIEIVSDALLQHHPINTRRWLSALLPTLKSKGFTTLAVVDPQMHPPEEMQAVLGLFDGEISIHEKETEKGAARFLKIKRLSNQKYAKDEKLLTVE